MAARSSDIGELQPVRGAHWIEGGRGGAEPMAQGASQRGSKQAMAKTSPGEFMRQVQAEARKVVWPTRQETVTTAIMVGIMMVILAVFFLGVDTLFGWVVRQLLSIAA
jgi:preprotein translocase subunit SecE